MKQWGGQSQGAYARSRRSSSAGSPRFHSSPHRIARGRSVRHACRRSRRRCITRTARCMSRSSVREVRVRSMRCRRRSRNCCRSRDRSASSSTATATAHNDKADGRDAQERLRTIGRLTTAALTHRDRRRRRLARQQADRRHVLREQRCELDLSARHEREVRRGLRRDLLLRLGRPAPDPALRRHARDRTGPRMLDHSRPCSSARASGSACSRRRLCSACRSRPRRTLPSRRRRALGLGTDRTSSRLTNTRSPPRPVAPRARDRTAPRRTRRIACGPHR